MDASDAGAPRNGEHSPGSEPGNAGEPRPRGDRKSLALWLLVALAVAWTLRETVLVTLPVAAALFVALAVAPVAAWVVARVPRRWRWLGHAAAMLVVLGMLALFIGGFALAGQQVAIGARQYLPQIQRQFEDSGLSQLVDSREIARSIQGATRYLFSAVTMAWHTVAALILIFFLVLLMLIEAPQWRAKVATVLGSDNHRQWEDAATAVGQQFRRYFVTRLVLGVVTGALYAGWLSIFGIDLLFLWALLALLLNFVPTVGSLIAGGLAALFAFAQTDPATAAIIAGGLFVIEQVMGNFIDPKLLGRQVAISPLVVLISLLVWTWVWGVAGALLSVPMTVLLTIVFAQVRGLQPVALFLSNQRDMAGLEERLAPH